MEAESPCRQLLSLFHTSSLTAVLRISLPGPGMAAAPPSHSLVRSDSVPDECQAVAAGGEAASLSTDGGVPQRSTGVLVGEEGGIISLTDFPKCGAAGARRRMPLQVEKLKAHWLVRWWASRVIRLQRCMAVSWSHAAGRQGGNRTKGVT